MKPTKLLLISALLITQTSIIAQTKEWYTTSGWEMPFQLANTATDIENMDAPNAVMRWAPALNLNFYGNYNFNKSFGLFAGLSLDNNGYIADFGQDSSKVRKKFRTYNLGVPVGIKLGNVNEGFFVYGGFQIDYAFNYKEKTFLDDKKDEKFVVWFGDRAEQLPMSVFAGIQTKHGFNLKFQYYLNNFHNTDFNSNVDGKVYSEIEANVYSFSLVFQVFKNRKLNYKSKEVPPKSV